MEHISREKKREGGRVPGREKRRRGGEEKGRREKGRGSQKEEEGREEKGREGGEEGEGKGREKRGCGGRCGGKLAHEGLSHNYDHFLIDLPYVCTYLSGHLPHKIHACFEVREDNGAISLHLWYRSYPQCHLGDDPKHAL